MSGSFDMPCSCCREREAKHGCTFSSCSAISELEETQGLCGCHHELDLNGGKAVHFKSC